LPEQAGAEELVARLFEHARQRTPVTLMLGGGVSKAAVPGGQGLLALADEYAKNRPDGAGLNDALRRARKDHVGDDLAVYRAYRLAFSAWVAGNEWDVVAQEAVLRAYRPAKPRFSDRGRWQRVEAALGENLESDVESWLVPEGLAALGSMLHEQPDNFHGRVLTTNVDPLLEVAVVRAGGIVDRVPLLSGGVRRRGGPDAPIAVHHLLGYWRPDLEHVTTPLLLAPDEVDEQLHELATRVSRLIGTSIVCVIDHSGPDPLLVEALRRTAGSGRKLTVLWGLRDAEDDTRALRSEIDRATSTGLPEALRLDIRYFHGIDSDTVFPLLAERLGVTVPPRPVTRRVRHEQWERELISEPGTRPPAGALDLLRQLDLRFLWARSWSGDPVAPKLVFWPVRLRTRPSVINMAQALAAAALSARGAHVVACLDDFNVDQAAAGAARFADDVHRWFDLVPGARRPDFVSLTDFIERNEFADATDIEAMKRPSTPWAVAREALGERNPSVLSVLMAAKVVPAMAPDELVKNADMIIRALQSESARRLLTPFTVWAYLNHLLQDRSITSVMTLGGHEESRLWDLWRLVFDHGVNQLYNPTIHSLTNQSLMLRWSDTAELRSYLDETLKSDDWAENGRYFKWLAQNAFLLPMYLADLPPPAFRGIRLDSWPAIYEAMAIDRAVVKVIAEEVSAVYLGHGAD
jgi:hypothetical protein